MSLRPRYSLLTLLILTAIVAGGVKLWRGPHHVVMSDPPTSEEEALLSQLDSLYVMNRFRPNLVYAYEYLNEVRRRKYLCVRGAFVGHRKILIEKWIGADAPSYSLSLNPIDEEAGKANSPTFNKEEHLVCWLYNPNCNDDLSSDVSMYRDLPLKLSDTHKIPCYFLSSHKKIYFFDKVVDAKIPLQPLDLNQIIDPEFRACVARELANVFVHQ